MKTSVNEPGDSYEQEADRIAEQVTREQVVHSDYKRGSPLKSPVVQRRVGESAVGLMEAGPIPDGLFHSPGQPLDTETRTTMESRFGHDFSQVRVHTGPLAAQSAAAVAAHAYTVGSNIVFGAGRYAPASRDGQRLLAHELTHVVQQSTLSHLSTVAQRQNAQVADVVAEREYGSSGAPKAQKCGRPSWCPAGFCDPYRSEQLAEYYRSKNGGWLMAGISAAVDSRVVPLWREYLWGGSSPKDLSADFGKDFTSSPTTKTKTNLLYDELKKDLGAKPPAVPLYSTTSLDIAALIPNAIADLDDPASPNQMNFSFPRDIPGNLAGGIAKDQRTCPAGAKPSPFDDERKASGTVIVTRLSAAELTVTPIISYRVRDTIDLCPGNCGSVVEQVATVPLSQFEATGISGDVPFTVNFPAPFLGQFTVAAPLAAASSPAPSPKKP